MASESVSEARTPVTVVDAAPARRGPRTGRWFRRTLQVVGIVVGALVALIALEQLVFSNRVLPGVHVDGVDVDMKTEDSARTRDQEHAERLETEPITATFGDQLLAIDPSDVDLKVDTTATAEAARDAGRAISTRWRSCGHRSNGSSPATTFRCRSVGTTPRSRPRSPIGNHNGHRVHGGRRDVRGNDRRTPVMPTVGMTVDAEAALAPVEAALASGTREPVTLPTKPVDPVLTEADVQRVADQATAVLSAPYEIVQGADRRADHAGAGRELVDDDARRPTGRISRSRSIPPSSARPSASQPRPSRVPAVDARFDGPRRRHGRHRAVPGRTHARLRGARSCHRRAANGASRPHSRPLPPARTTAWANRSASRNRSPRSRRSTRAARRASRTSIGPLTSCRTSSSSRARRSR